LRIQLAETLPRDSQPVSSSSRFQIAAALSTSAGPVRIKPAPNELVPWRVPVVTIWSPWSDLDALRKCSMANQLKAPSIQAPFSTTIVGPRGPSRRAPG
jgi:hypothetical protein